jgi:hypothetical protein
MSFYEQSAGAIYLGVLALIFFSWARIEGVLFSVLLLSVFLSTVRIPAMHRRYAAIAFAGGSAPWCLYLSSKMECGGLVAGWQYLLMIILVVIIKILLIIIINMKFETHIAEIKANLKNIPEKSLNQRVDEKKLRPLEVDKKSLNQRVDEKKLRPLEVDAGAGKGDADSYRSAGMSIHGLGVYVTLIHGDAAERKACEKVFEDIIKYIRGELT